MSKAGDGLVRCCNSLHRFPSLLLCFLLILIQDCFTNYYLVDHLGTEHLYWTVPDLIVVILVVVCFRLTSQTKPSDDNGNDHSRTFTIVWVTWLAMQAVLAAKVIVICLTFATDLAEEDSFFGPNTLKTTIALGSCIFVLLLTSQHDAPPSSERRRYIEELTGTVVFDILDTADILDVLFDKDDRSGLDVGIPEMILLVASLNLLLPTVPLITLSKTKFGLQKLSKRMVYLHRLLLVLAVNVPNLVVRMTLWHGFSVGISPFCLKNFILICMTAYEFYEHKKEKFEMHKEERERELEGVGNGDGNGNAISMLKTHETESRKDDKDGKHVNGNEEQSPNYNDSIHFDIESRMITSM